MERYVLTNVCHRNVQNFGGVKRWWRDFQLNFYKFQINETFLQHIGNLHERVWTFYQGPRRRRGRGGRGPPTFTSSPYTFLIFSLNVHVLTNVSAPTFCLGPPTFYGAARSLYCLSSHWLTTRSIRFWASCVVYHAEI